VTDEGNAGPGVRLRVSYRVVIAAASAILLVLAQREVSTWVDRTGAFVSVAALVVALALLLDWVADLILPGLWKVLKSVGPRVASAVSGDPALARALARFPRADAWLRARLSTREWTGWYLTATVLLAAWLLWPFIEVSANLALGSALVTYDPRLAGLLHAIRTPDLTRVMWASTLLGDGLVVAALTVLGCALFLLWGRRARALYLASVVASGAALQAIVKLVVQRERPPVDLMLIAVPGGWSYPSGHTVSSLLLLGALAFLAARGLPGVRRRLVSITLAVVGVTMVGVSRVYLGVHWPTDVLAAWALGAAWLALGSGALVTWERYGPREIPRPVLDRRARVALTVLVAGVAVGCVVYAGASDPVLSAATRSAPTRALPVGTGADGLPVLTTATVEALPRFSEKLDGSRQEPIGMVFIGTKAQLVGAFEAAGWRVADQAAVATVARAAVAAALDQPYSTAPVTPTYLDGRVQDVAFQEETKPATARVRHHTRFWLTRYTANGEPVWVATASFDEGIAIGSAIHLPTHRIAPDIDTERDYIVTELESTGRVAGAGTVRVSPPVSGTNAQGDPWFTQGLAVVLVAR
jgi:membrane-associated phospholipid phosphatase